MPPHPGAVKTLRPTLSSQTQTSAIHPAAGNLLSPHDSRHYSRGMKAYAEAIEGMVRNPKEVPAFKPSEVAKMRAGKPVGSRKNEVRRLTTAHAHQPLIHE